MIDYREIAKDVIKLARDIDARFAASLPASQEDRAKKVSAWAAVLDGKAWPEEARQAVVDHYRSTSFPITVTDIVNACQRRPVWSSESHVRDWLGRFAVQNPYSRAIEAWSGIGEPEWEISPEIGREGEKAHLIEKLSEWVGEREDELVAAIMAKRFLPVGWEGDQA